ncbi:MAG: hypothetical protein IT350_13380 [Deltaproteobacteria bacterium]|nr:hypothetical protein [Deltaproteobacteria bacterium]
MPVRDVVAVVCVLLVASFLVGCPSRPDTPDSTQAWADVQTQLDRDMPGQSINQLKSFLILWNKYEVGTLAEKAIAEIEADLDDTVNRALDRARNGEFRAATATLEDVASNFANTAAGKAAAKQLEWELPMMHAKSLLMKHRQGAAKKILERLLAANPKGERAAEVNALLNNISLVDTAERQAESARMRAVAAKIRMHMAVQIANNDAAPLTFGTADLAKIDEGSGRLSETVTVESYTANGKDFRVVVKSKTDGIEPWEITPDVMRPVE